MDYNKIRRGWVWFINSEVGYEGHLQGGPRPWLVVSNNDCNQHSPVIHMAPLTSQPKRPLPTHVRFKNNKGVYNTILCEQIQAFNIESIAGRALYELSQEVLDEVDKAIGIQFGVCYTPISYKDIDTYYSYVEAFYRDEFDIKVAQMKKDLESVCKGLISEFDKKISDIAEKKVLECTNKGVPENITVQGNKLTQIEKFEKKYGKSVDKNRNNTYIAVSSKQSIGNSTDKKPVSKDTKKGNNKWDMDRIKEFFKVYASGGPEEINRTYNLAFKGIPSAKSIFLNKYKATFTVEQKREFISDCNNLTVSKVMDKWCLPTKKDVMKFRSGFEVELGV